MVEVEQGPLGALEQYVFAVPEHLLEQHAGVGDVRCELLAVAAVGAVDLLEVQGLFLENRSQVDVLLRDIVLEFLAKGIFFQQVDDPYSDPGGLVLVGGSDAPAGGADLAGAAHPLTGLIDGPVVGHDQVCLLADPELGVVLQVTLLPQFLELVQ